MALGKVAIALAGLIGLVGVFLFNDYFTEQRQMLLDSMPSNLREKYGFILSVSASGSQDFVLSKKELKQYDGTEGSPGLYLAILGEVYDVSKGERHYGPGNGYAHFSGLDGSRAFVTGEFTVDGIVDNTDGLTPTQAVELDEWRKFYRKSYKYIGKLEGNFYDAKGQPTKALQDFYNLLSVGEQQQKNDKADKTMYPDCNSEWSQAAGGRVWCSVRSGGIERNWEGVPRQYHKPGGQSTRCACVRTEGPPGDNPTAKTNRGDLDDPKFKVYDNCSPESFSCRIINPAK